MRTTWELGQERVGESPSLGGGLRVQFFQSHSSGTGTVALGLSFHIYKTGSPGSEAKFQSQPFHGSPMSTLNPYS